MAQGISEWRGKSADNHVGIVIGLLMVLLWAGQLMFNRTSILAEPDLQWHIKTGEWIWINAAVPTVDPFSYTFADQPWIAKEWLSQVLFFSGYTTLGWNGVVLLTLLAFAAGVWTLYGALSRELAPIPAAVGCIVAILLASPSFTVRPHLLTLVLFVIWTHQLFTASRRQDAPHFGLLLLLVLWANLHGAFTLGFVIAFFAFLDFIEQTRFSKKDVALKWVLFLALCPVVTLFHPYFWQAIQVTWNVVGPNEAVALITEWQPFNAQVHVVPHIGLLGLVFLAVVTGFRLGIARALLLVLLLHLFLTHVRYGFYFFPVLVIVAAPELARQFPRLSAEVWRNAARDPIETAISRYFGRFAAGFAALLVMLGAVQAFVLRTAPRENVTAASAIGYARQQGISGNVMNYYNFGGALILNGIPTFLDGRTDQLFLNGFVRKFAFGPDKAEELSSALKQYDVTWTLFPPPDARVALLDEMPGWRRVYSDEFAVIHLREGTRAQ